jgi:hypothetical protein
MRLHAKLPNLLNQDAAAAGETTTGMSFIRFEDGDSDSEGSLNFIRFGNVDSNAEESPSERCRISRSASSSFFFSSLARINSTWATFITTQREVGTQHGLGSNFELA